MGVHLCFEAKKALEQPIYNAEVGKMGSAYPTIQHNKMDGIQLRSTVDDPLGHFNLAIGRTISKILHTWSSNGDIN